MAGPYQNGRVAAAGCQPVPAPEVTRARASMRRGVGVLILGHPFERGP
jgi:hypothetical protein